MEIGRWHIKISANEQNKNLLQYISYNTNPLIKLTNYNLHNFKKATFRYIWNIYNYFKKAIIIL